MARIVLFTSAMHKNSLLLAVASTLLLIGCAGSAHVRGSASVSAPDLVYVSPGVQVIADYREPIFYSDNYYWRYNGSVWYRSSNYTSGWVRFQAPVAILRIERPSAYIHYRGQARVNPGPVVQAPQAQPITHEDRKEMKAEQKEERKEIKAEQKEERKEMKEERKEMKEERKEQREERKEDHKDAKKGKR